jgi:hypothetical protein
MAQIEGEIVIERLVDEVFDFVADERHEPRFNARMVQVELLSDGPIGLGTRFRTELQTMGRTMPMMVEFAIFDEVADALGCAVEVRESSLRLGLELRAGVHLGHSWNADDKCAGADVHVGARLAGMPARARWCSRKKQRNAPVGRKW